MARAAQVVAKDNCVIVVGSRPIEYQRARVRDRRTGELTAEPIDLHEFPPVDEGATGVPYAFKAGQTVPKAHDAVKASPGHFVSLDEAESMGLVDA